ncbi:PREDICTED: uncharacterized protein LOC106741974 isoform X2 [Dinoponera quadriceps]|uniref:Uncharacterized protein LOC106741974 isoform X2 n=1 Tax=Dinoponera quadriceps TaxID=609295 RepID=A0A6P3WVQ0_DINQU|nr:PREDICTED: uncharacterized protein LOC106741974 isoform X2 [Dinoponera quadriceps]
MCDLIDLNSSGLKDLANSGLASPLIPVPRNVEESSGEQVDASVTGKNGSLGSNPFDSMLHETTEYIRRKGDPFEVVLQRALKFESRKDHAKEPIAAQPVNFADDDFTLIHGKGMMNRTLDESLIEDGGNSIDGEEEGITSVVAGNADVTCDAAAESDKPGPEQSNKVTACMDPYELAILNQSAMNDTLLEAEFKHKTDSEMSIFLEKNPSFKEFILPASSNLKLRSNLQRSLSQEDRKSEKRKLQRQDRRSQFSADTSRKASQSDSTASSFLNKGFSEIEGSQQSVFSKISTNSVFSNLSDVPFTSRLNSVSLLSNPSSVSSNGVMNNAFIDNNSLRMSNERISTEAENSMEIKSVQYDLSDLTERLNKLKCAIDRTTSTLIVKEEIGKSDLVKGENNKQAIDDRLIDIDVFVPEPSSNEEQNKSINSTNSSDSVFTDSSKIDKSILNEAKAFARTFEELALKTDSASSSSADDLISNNHLWMSDLLPAYEDEAVDNLIELPISPEKNLKVDRSNVSKQSTNIDSAVENFLKEMEPQFADDVSTVRQTMVTTLLMDLKKLIKAENNSQASKLIDNLENVLGVKYKNNTELLASLNASDKSEKFGTSDDKLDDTKQSDEASNKSQKENEEISSVDKICNNENSLPHISHELEDATQVTTGRSYNSLTGISSCNNDSENCFNVTDSPKTALKTSHSDEKLAVELLVNLGKLLSGQSEDAVTLKLLKSIGKALNVVSNNSKIDGESQMDNDNSRNIRRISSVGTSVPERNTSLSSLKKTWHEQSFNSKPLENTRRRSVPTINSSNANTPINSKRKSTSELKNRKRFSNNIGLLSTIPNKNIPISGVSNAKIVETTELDSKNEKSLAIIDVKNKLKKKVGAVGNRGPMKAVHPVGSMQKKDSQTNGSSKMQLMPISKKRNFSCDISPVTTQKGDNPRRSNKSLTTKKCTPKHQQTDLSGIPKYCTPPRKQHNASLDMSKNRQQKTSQYLNKSLTSYQRCSPIRSKSAEKQVRSPLKDSNKIFTKVKPFKLISKLKGNAAIDSAEKENYSEQSGLKI